MRTRVASVSFFAVAVAAVVYLFAGEESALGQIAAAAGVGFMLVFIALEVGQAKPLQLITSLALVVLGLIAIGFVAGSGLAGLGLVYEGLVRNLQYILLFASIVWLQVQATQSPSLLELRERVMAMPSGSRSVPIMAVAYGLGAAFNIAAFGLMAPLVTPATPQPLRERLVQAVSKGFMIATAWSPLFVGTAVILASVDGVRWTDVGLGGFLLALVLVSAQWGFDGLWRRIDPTAAKARLLKLDPADRTPLRLTLPVTLVRAGLIILSLFAILVVAVAGFGLRIPVALALAAPLFGLVWAGLIRREVGAEAAGPLVSIRRVFNHYPNLRGEALLFAAANVFGIGIQAVLDAQFGQTSAGGGGGASLAAVLGWHEAALLLACIWAFFMICVLGMHPLISVILLTTLFTPSDLGLVPWQFAVMMMALWGTSTNASPVSASTILMSRMTELSNFRIAWRLNLPFSVLNVLVISAVFLVLQTLF